MNAEPKLQPLDAALLRRIDARALDAGDLVSLNPPNGRQYVIGVVYSEATDGRPYLLLRVNDGATVGVVAWFEVVGRCGRADVTLVAKGAWLSRVDYWRTRHPW